MNPVRANTAAIPHPLLRRLAVAYSRPKKPISVTMIPGCGSFNATLAAVTAALKNSVADNSSQVSRRTRFAPNAAAGEDEAVGDGKA